jgi:hypothetical protein
VTSAVTSGMTASVVGVETCPDPVDSPARILVQSERGGVATYPDGVAMQEVANPTP